MKSVREITCTKRSKNCYAIRYTTAGKTLYVYGKTALECRENYRQIISEHKAPRLAKGYTFGLWYEKYIDLYKKPVVKESTLNAIKSTFKLYILPYIQNKNIRIIRTDELQEIINRISDKPRTQTVAYIQLNACFNQAFKTNVIHHNPCSAIVIKKNKGNKGKAMTKEQQIKLLNYLKTNDTPIKNLLLIYLYTGMRLSELISINFEDLYFESKQIHIRGTKTKQSDRVIPTSLEVLYLFPIKEKPFAEWNKSKLTYWYNKIKKDLKFKGLTIHSLRHTFATNCIEAGVDMVVVQQWLGHASISMTIDTYTHVDNEYKLKEFEKIKNTIKVF